MNLITGSNGSAAYYLADELRGDCVGLARPDCDLTNFTHVCDKLDELKPDVIYHLASYADVGESFNRVGYTMHNNVAGTVNLLEACRKLNIRPVIQICSTSEVYGNPGPQPVTESQQLAPINPYAVSKTTQDLLGSVYAKAYGFRVVITRAFGYVNPRRASLSLSSFARQIVAVERGLSDAVPHGNLKSVRTFCDVRDIVRAYRVATEKEGVFNIGSERPISIGDALDIIVGFATCPIRLVSNPALMRPTDVTHMIPDCTKFRNATGWEPQIPLEESLKWLLSICRASV